MSTKRTRQAPPRAPRTQPTTPPRNVTVTEPVAPDPICDELDRLDADEMVSYLSHGDAKTAAVVAGWDEEKKARAAEMVDVQRVYLQLMEDLIDPTDQGGRTHDLRAMESTRLAICWTMALCGYRRSGKAYIRKRRLPDLGGTYGSQAYTWVDARAPETAEDDLLPEDRADTRIRPPDVRSLAAQRDGEEPRVLAEWHVTPEVKTVNAPRPKDW